jgi:predicted unusual protein kinase regulating ubiquinone biosynthesis (AarF/ABC1/UbiB family)
MITKRERYRQILILLTRHGVGLVDDEFFKHDGPDQARAEHLRRACDELGPVFIKVGQALSTRDELTGPAHQPGRGVETDARSTPTTKGSQ